MNCPGCGAELDAAAKFCGECGGRINPDHSSESANRSDVTRAPDLPSDEHSRIADGLQILERADQTPLDRLTLHVAGRTRFGRIHVLGSPMLSFGRAPDRNDVTLWALPRTPENDVLTRQISSSHFQLAFASNGLTLTDSSTYGTSINGDSVSGTAAVPLDRISHIDVTSSLQLRVIPFLGGTSPLPDGVTYDSLAPDDDLHRQARQSNVTAIMIERVSSLTDGECYLWLFDHAVFGPAVRTSDSAVATLPGPELVLARRGGGFWLHNVAVPEPVLVNSTTLPHGCVTPITTGDDVRLGTRQLRARMIDQIDIDAA